MRKIMNNLELFILLKLGEGKSIAVYFHKSGWEGVAGYCDGAEAS